MVYAKVEIDASTLPTNTTLRFLEIEMSLGLSCLEKLYAHTPTPYKHAREVLVAHLIEDKIELRRQLDNAFSSDQFRFPTKDEMIQYFRYKNLGNAKVVKLAKCSPNTVQNYKDKYPNYQPVFPSWIEFFPMLNRWEYLKSNLNLFNEELAHMKNSYRPR